jgi:hypothetical protein
MRAAFFLLALVACSGGGGSEATTTTSDASASNVPAAALDIVVNEFSAVGSSEWIEIGNEGTAAFDLSDYALADSDKSTGAAKTSDAMKFPSGTSIPAGGRILVLVSKKDQPVGPHTKAECLSNGPDTCFFATWGVSASSGEPVHFLAKDGSVISSTAYPRNLGIDPAAGQTLCRLPDFTGEFATCRGTPGAANAAP